MDPEQEVLQTARELKQAVQDRFGEMERRIRRVESPANPEGFTPVDSGELGRARLERARAVGVLQRGDSFADWLREAGVVDEPPAPSDFSLGRVLAAMATGKREILSDVERQALSEGTDSRGGFLLSPALGAPVIDLARSAARTIEAGAQTIPLSTDELNWPRLVGGTTPAWMAELAPFTPQDLTFDRLTFDAETCRVVVKLSEELFEDLSPAGYAAIENDLTQQLGLAIDYAALRGNGVSPQPMGVRFTPGVTLVAHAPPNGAPLTNYNPIAAAYWAVAGFNFEPSAVLYSARTAGALDGLKNTSNDPLEPPASVAGLTKLVTNQIPNNLTEGTSTDASEAYVGQWDQLLIGVRPTIGAQVRQIDAGLAEDFSLSVVCWVRADTQLAHEKAFAVVTGIRP